MEQTELKLESVNFENTNPKKIISDVRLEEITSKLISDGFQILEHDEILFQIIKYTKCEKTAASDIFERMNELGLGICHHLDFGYSIRRFANMRGYLSDSELELLNKKTLEKLREANTEVAKFMEKYGVDKTEWSDEVADEYEYGLDVSV